MQRGMIVRGFLAGPSDVSGELDAATLVITDWNAAHSFGREVLIEAVRMTTHCAISPRSEPTGYHQRSASGTLRFSRCDLLVTTWNSHEEGQVRHITGDSRVHRA